MNISRLKSAGWKHYVGDGLNHSESDLSNFMCHFEDGTVPITISRILDAAEGNMGYDLGIEIENENYGEYKTYILIKIAPFVMASMCLNLLHDEPENFE